LVLVPVFPAQVPPPAVAEAPGSGPSAGGGRDSLEAEVERTLARLVPPPGPSDAAIVAALYRVARLLDDSVYGLDRVKDAGTLVPKYVQLLRELKATRASASAVPVKGAGLLASGQF
jgi:hypothetical protein